MPAKKKPVKGGNPNPNVNNKAAAAANKSEPVAPKHHEGETVSALIAAEEAAAKASVKVEKSEKNSAKKAPKAEDPFKPSAELAAEVAALQQTNQARRNNVTRLTQERTKDSKELERVRGQLESRKKELVALRAQLEENEGRISGLGDEIVATKERSERKAAVIARREEIAQRNAFTPSTGAGSFLNPTVRIGSAALASEMVSDDEVSPVAVTKGRGRGGRGAQQEDHSKKPTRSSSKGGDIIGAVGVTIPAPRGNMRAPPLSSFGSFDSSPAVPNTPEAMPRSHSSPFADPVSSGGYNVFSGVGGLGGSAHPSPFSGPSHPTHTQRQSYNGYTNTPPSHMVGGQDHSSPDDSGSSTPQPLTGMGRGFPSAQARSTLTPGAAPFEPSSLNQSSSGGGGGGGWTVTGNATPPSLQPPASQGNVASLFASASKNAPPPSSASSSTSSALQFQVTRNAVNMPPGAMGANGYVADPPAKTAGTPYYPAGAARNGNGQGRGRGDFGFGSAEEYHPVGHPRNPQTQGAYYGQSRGGQWGM